MYCLLFFFVNMLYARHVLELKNRELCVTRICSLGRCEPNLNFMFWQTSFVVPPQGQSCNTFLLAVPSVKNDVISKFLENTLKYLLIAKLGHTNCDPGCEGAELFKWKTLCFTQETLLITLAGKTITHEKLVQVLFDTRQLAAYNPFYFWKTSMADPCFSFVNCWPHLFSCECLLQNCSLQHK